MIASRPIPPPSPHLSFVVTSTTMTRLSIVGVVLALLASAGSARAQDQDPCTNTFGELCGCDGGGVVCGSTCDVRTDACCANVATCDPSSTEEGSREACST